MTDTPACRSCRSKTLEEFLDLGIQPLANSLVEPDGPLHPELKYPLRVAVCRECRLVQIMDVIPPATLFDDYVYFSSFSDAMLRHSAEAARQHISTGKLDHGSFVVEIASNDGYLLKNFLAAGVPCLGIEPARNIAKVAEAAGVPTLCRFFGKPVAAEIVDKQGSADLILGNNVFAHAPDINDFIGGMAMLLKENGRIVLEFPYLGSFVENLEFDTVYHEHVFYFSLMALEPAFEKHGLEIFDVERLTIHGGSLRLYAGYPGLHPITGRLQELRKGEAAAGMASLSYYHQFSTQVRKLREELTSLLRELKAEGKTIAAYGASAKGSTLLNYFGIGPETLDFVADRSTYKHHRLTPGTHLPILPAEALLEKSPDYTLLLTWNFADEILEQQTAYRLQGGKFIIPLPEPHIV